MFIHFINILKYKLFIVAALLLGRKNELNLPRILTYHNVTNKTDNYFSIKISEFEKQIKLLSDLNYKSINIEEIFSKTEVNNKEKIIYLTFDDGYKEVFRNAIPILKRYKFNATFFITTNYISNDINSKYMSWDEVRILKKSGFKLGLHSHSHRMLSKLNFEELKKDIYLSKKNFYEQLGFNTNLFSIPFGKKDSFDEKVIQNLKNEGFEFIFTQINGAILNNTSQFEIPRNNISGLDNDFSFNLKLNGYFDFFKHFVKSP